MRPNVHKTLARRSGDKHLWGQTCLALPDPTVHVSVAENMAASDTKRLPSVSVVIRVFLYKRFTAVYYRFTAVYYLQFNDTTPVLTNSIY